MGPASIASDNHRQPPVVPILVIGIFLGPPLLLLLLVSCPSGSGKRTQHCRSDCLQLSVYTYNCLSATSLMRLMLPLRAVEAFLTLPTSPAPSSSQPLKGLFP